MSIPFTDLQYLISNDGKPYQLIMQKSIDGKLVAIGLDLALVPIYDCRRRMAYPINDCIDKRLQTDFTKDMEKAIVNCLIDRLNQCY